MSKTATTGPRPVAHLEIRSDPDGPVVVLSGRLDATSTPELWARLEQQVKDRKLGSVEVDASGLDFCDGSGMALLHYLAMGRMTRGQSVRFGGLRPELERLFRAFDAADYESLQPKIPGPRSVVHEVGRVVRTQVEELADLVGFIGSLTRSLPANLMDARRMRWAEVRRVFEMAGANALPIVTLISLLVGFIIAFESAGPFSAYGAELLIADMTAFVMTRELGPLMTAIIVAGRSGSAFAAELGTMKVNEELNALETMGLDPMRFLVVQRITAGLLLLPVLTVYAMAVGVVGGVMVLLSMGFPFLAIYHQMATVIGVDDISVGLVKGLAFGAIIALIGCWRGLRTGFGPSAVGESTTRAVVSAILLIIVADAVFSVVLYNLGI